jgi:molybdate transport system ATP-binding protein
VTERHFLRVSLHQRAPIPLAAELTCAPGEITALIGPSGSGKTSILRCIAGLLAPSEGRIECGGQVWFDSERQIALSPQARRVGLLFQDYALFPHLDALSNVREALTHLKRRGRDGRARELLAQVRLAGLEGRRPEQLSGGQRQRVALARALAREPSVLLLDEPFSAVDQITRRKLQEELARLHREIQVPILLVTHDLAEAAALADRMVVLGRGRTLQAGPPADLITRPRNRGVARLVGQRNLFRGVIRGPSGDRPGILLLEWQGRLLEVKSDLPSAPGTPVDWMIPAASVLWQRRDRPSAGDRENPVEGRVLDLLALGDNCAITFATDGPDEQRLFLNLPAHVTRRLGLGIGERGRVSLLAAHIHLMPRGQGGALDDLSGSAPGRDPRFERPRL